MPRLTQRPTTPVKTRLPATVDASNHVKLKTVVIARDMGAAADVARGVSPTDRIIDNPADALQNGDEVRVANP